MTAQPIPTDFAWLKAKTGDIITDLMGEVAQARGIAMAAQQALAEAEKASAADKARIVELEAEVEKLRASAPEVSAAAP